MNTQTIFDKLGKLHIQNIIAFIIIFTCSGIAIGSMFLKVPHESKDMITNYFNMGMVGVIGWAFTQSKTRQRQDEVIAKVAATQAAAVVSGAQASTSSQPIYP